MTLRTIEKENTLSIMGNHPSQIADEMMDFPTAVSVPVINLAPNTARIFRFGDLTFFRIFKQEGLFYFFFDNFITIIAFVDNVYVKRAKRLTGPHIRPVFQTIVVEFHMGETAWLFVSDQCVRRTLEQRISFGIAEAQAVECPILMA
jgi:hypothetical protein